MAPSLSSAHAVAAIVSSMSNLKIDVTPGNGKVCRFGIWGWMALSVYAYCSLLSVCIGCQDKNGPRG